MGRIPRVKFTMKEFTDFVQESEPLNPDVYYSPFKDEIYLSFDGKRSISLVGRRGIFFTKGKYLSSSYVNIGKLLDF